MFDHDLPSDHSRLTGKADEVGSLGATRGVDRA
jgi:hypothetical protein